jgi:hypothetical protein
VLQLLGRLSHCRLLSLPSDSGQLKPQDERVAVAENGEQSQAHLRYQRWSGRCKCVETYGSEVAQYNEPGLGFVETGRLYRLAAFDSILIGIKAGLPAEGFLDRHLLNGSHGGFGVHG